jgi:AraC family transcriptional activator of mtrCDE
MTHAMRAAGFCRTHDRLVRDHPPPRLVVHAGDHNADSTRSGTAAQLAGLVKLMRAESAADRLGGRAMLNALSTAMFALVLRLASESADAPVGLLALAGHPRLAPANRPARWRMRWAINLRQHSSAPSRAI